MAIRKSRRKAADETRPADTLVSDLCPPDSENANSCEATHLSFGMEGPVDKYRFRQRNGPLM